MLLLMKLMCKYEKKKISPPICDSSVKRQILHYRATATVTPLILQRVAIDKLSCDKKNRRQSSTAGPWRSMQMRPPVKMTMELGWLNYKWRDKRGTIRDGWILKPIKMGRTEKPERVESLKQSWRPIEGREVNKMGLMSSTWGRMHICELCATAAPSCAVFHRATHVFIIPGQK